MWNTINILWTTARNPAGSQSASQAEGIWTKSMGSNPSVLIDLNIILDVFEKRDLY